MIAANDGGVSAIPNQPARPIAPIIEKTIIIKVVKVPLRPLTQKYNTMIKTNIIPGNRVVISYWLASGKAWFIMMIPVSLTSIPGNICRNSSRRSRIKSTTWGFSTIGSTPGNSMVMLTPVTCALGDIRRLIRTGSSRAILRIFASSASLILPGSKARSSTSKSSPTAEVCW